MEKYKRYAKHIGGDQYLVNWVDTTLASYTKNNTPNTEEVEHILDYLVSDAAPKRISKMSYEQAKVKAEAWVKALQKKGEDIMESPEDTETILDFGDGFRVVKLIRENAYKREGFLMHHCVADYYDKDVEVYSLRDSDNMPHCTIEKDQQIRGKGNGDVHPKYVDYVVEFLKHVGMRVGDDEMEHLGYVNAEGFLDELNQEALDLMYDNKYFPVRFRDKFTDKEGKQIVRLDVLTIFPLLEEVDNSLRITVDPRRLLSASTKWIQSKVGKQGGNRAQLAGGERAQLAGGYGAQLAGGYEAQLAGGYGAQLVGGYGAQLAGGEGAQLAGGERAQLAGGYGAQLAGGERAQLVGGEGAQLAGGHGAQLVGDDRAQLAGDDGAQLTGGEGAQLAGGQDTVIVGGTGAVARGGKRSVITLIETNREGHIINYKTEQVDGKRIKEDIWYKLENGKFTEVTDID